MDNRKIFTGVHDDTYNILECQEELGVDEQPVDAEEVKQHVTVTHTRPASSVNQYKLLVVSLVVLAVLLLTVDIGLGIHYSKLNRGYLVTDISNEMAKLQAVYDQAFQSKQEAQNQLVKERSDHQFSKWELEHQDRRDKDFQKLLDQIHMGISRLQSHLPMLKEGCRRCLPGWRFIDSMCYFFAVSETLSSRSWHASRQFCQKYNADLIVIKTREKQLIVTEFIHHYYDKSKVFHQNGFWTGLTDAEYEGVWKWVDGTRLSDGYWHVGEPNNQQNEDCAAVYPSQNPFRSWNDAPCNYNLKWICEKEPTSIG